MQSSNQSKLVNQSMQKGQAGSKSKDEEKKQDKEKKQEFSSEELILQKQISTVEETALKNVFRVLCRGSLQPDEGGKGSQKVDAKDQRLCFDARKLEQLLKQLEYPASKQEIDQMIWEIDEDLDGFIDDYEFLLMYKRCRFDDTYLEPRTLYNVVQFLMYLQNNQNDQENTKELKTKITVEDTLEQLYVKYGRNLLDEEIEEIFGKDENKADGQEKKISLSEYLEKIRKKDFNTRKQVEENRKKLLEKEKNNKD